MVVHIVIYRGGGSGEGLDWEQVQWLRVVSGNILVNRPSLILAQRLPKCCSGAFISVQPVLEPCPVFGTVTLIGQPYLAYICLLLQNLSTG
jgi:hypothetical protein